MTKKVPLNYDFVAVFIALFVASCAYNIYQQFQYKDLFAAHTELTWSAQNAEANLVYIRNQLEACKKQD